MIAINCISLICSSSGSVKIVKKLQELLNTKGSAESQVMEILGDATLIKHLMTLTDMQVCIYVMCNSI